MRDGHTTASTLTVTGVSNGGESTLASCGRDDEKENRGEAEVLQGTHSNEWFRKTSRSH